MQHTISNYLSRSLAFESIGKGRWVWTGVLKKQMVPRGAAKRKQSIVPQVKEPRSAVADGTLAGMLSAMAIGTIGATVSEVAGRDDCSQWLPQEP